MYLIHSRLNDKKMHWGMLLYFLTRTSANKIYLESDKSDEDGVLSVSFSIGLVSH